MVALRFAARLPKIGNQESECEDVFRVRPAGEGSALRVAVSDGAGDSLFPERWATLLCDAFCNSGNAFLTELSALRAAWLFEAGREALPWYAQARLDRGSAATFLGVEVSSAGEWECLAVGDSILFQVRGEELVAAFPLSHADDFSGLPLLLTTSGETLPPARLAGKAEPGDDLFLVTDALAVWCFRERDRGGSPWAWLRSFFATDSFARFQQEQADLGRLRNDDLTLVWLHFMSEENASPAL